MSIDVLSDFLPSKEECLKESEVEHKTFDLSIEVNKDKNEENLNNKSEEKRYHDVLENSEVLVFIIFSLLSTRNLLALKFFL